MLFRQIISRLSISEHKKPKVIYYIRRWKSDESKVAGDDDTKKNALQPSSVAIECIKECKPPSKELTLYAPIKSVNVTILNAMSRLYTYLGVLLKLNRNINEIRMYDETNYLRGATIDITHFDTSPKVHTFVGPHQLNSALKGAHIVIIPGLQEPHDVPNSAKIFNANAPYVKKMATLCVTNCPDATFIITAYPVTSTLPMFSEILFNNGVLCPNRVIGSVAMYEMYARSLASRILGLNPANVFMDIVGGGTPQTVVPIVSGAEPGGEIIASEFKVIHKKLKSVYSNLVMKHQRGPIVSAAHALSLLIDKVAKGMTGKHHDKTSVFIRSSALFSTKYLTLPSKFGLGGVETISGLPLLSSLEIDALDLAISELKVDVTRGEEYTRPKVEKVTVDERDCEDAKCEPFPSCLT